MLGTDIAISISAAKDLCLYNRGKNNLINQKML